MVTPSQPTIANITIQDLERRVHDKLPFQTSLYYPYVDNNLLYIDKLQINPTLTFFDSFHPTLHYKSKIPNSDAVNFFDASATTSVNQISTNRYHRSAMKYRNTVVSCWTR